MKILFIHYGGGVGGAPVSMLQLAAALDRKRYAPLVVFTQSGPVLDFARELGVPTQVVPLRSAFFYSAHVPIRLRMLVPFLAYFGATVRAAERLVLRERPDLVHLNTSVLIPAAIGVKRAGVPLVWHAREVPGSNHFLRHWQIATISRLADCVVATSHHVGRMFPPSARVEVVHNALDLHRFQIDESRARARIRSELGLPSDAPVVVMIGSVQAVKGHYLLVKAAREVAQAHPDARFVIVAGGVEVDYARSWRGKVKTALGLPLDNMAAMQRQIARAGLTDYFLFTGYRNDIPELLAASDVVAFLPQAAEGFGRPLIEAMAAGRPLVATDIGPTREILGEETGLLVPPGETDALALALVELLNEPDRRQQMGVVGRERVARCFRMEQHVAKMAQIYTAVLDKCQAVDATSSGTYVPEQHTLIAEPESVSSAGPRKSLTSPGGVAQVLLALAWLLLVFGAYFYQNLVRVLSKVLDLLGIGG